MNRLRRERITWQHSKRRLPGLMFNSEWLSVPLPFFAIPIHRKVQSYLKRSHPIHQVTDMRTGPIGSRWVSQFWSSSSLTPTQIYTSVPTTISEILCWYFDIQADRTRGSPPRWQFFPLWTAAHQIKLNIYAIVACIVRSKSQSEL